MMHQTFRSRDLPSIPKTDMRNIAPVSPIAPTAPTAPNANIAPITPPLPTGLSPQEFSALSAEDKALVLRGGQNTVAKQMAHQELAQQVSNLQTELDSIPKVANPVPISTEELAKVSPPTIQSVAPSMPQTQVDNSWAGHGFEEPLQPALQVTPEGRVEVEKPQVAAQKEEPNKTGKKKTEVSSFKSIADNPAGYKFLPEVGNLDRSLGNILGLEHRANAREMFTGGKPFGQFTGSGPKAYNEEISRLTTDYFKNLQSEIPETILSRDARRAQGIPSDFGTYANKINFGKAAKVAGVAGTLIAVADLANAKTREQQANAGTNLLGAVLPPGTDILEAGAPTLGKKQLKAFEEAKKLGSPYRSVPPR